MIKRIITLLFLCGFVFSGINNDINGNVWANWSNGEKDSFLKGFYSSQLTLNNHLKNAIQYDSSGDPYWKKPFVLVMYEQNMKEFTSVKMGINIGELGGRLDAFYGDSDNKIIAVIEAIRIICLRADGDIERADWFVLQSRRNAGDN